jgi:hypothetical protein
MSQESLEQERNVYSPLAQESSTLFFVIAALSKVDNMYQFRYIKTSFATILHSGYECCCALFKFGNVPPTLRQGTPHQRALSKPVRHHSIAQIENLEGNVLFVFFCFLFILRLLFDIIAPFESVKYHHCIHLHQYEYMHLRKYLLFLCIQHCSFALNT